MTLIMAMPFYISLALYKSSAILTEVMNLESLVKTEELGM
jgi:hypothetical protein